MTKEAEISTCISGSFKFKPEIDRLIEEFQDLHVRVLSPEKGWLVVPKFHILLKNNFRPLPSEKNMTVKQVENNFLTDVKKSTFLYVANFGGYTGCSTNFEIGFALGIGKPIYSIEKIANIENDLLYGEDVKSIKIMTPKDTVEDILKQIIELGWN